MGYCFLYKRGGGGGGSNRPVVVKTVLGSVISLTDSTNGKLKGLRIFGKTTQNGTPSPATPVPLESVGDDGDTNVTVCGKNLFNPALLSQEAGYNTFDESTGLWTTSSAGLWGRSILMNTVGTSSIRDINKLIKVPRNASITITFFDFVSNTGSVYTFNVRCCDATGAPLGSEIGSKNNTLTFTTLEQCDYIDIIRGNNSGTLSFSKIQIEVGSTATAYEPYKEPQTLTVPTPNGLPGVPVPSGGNYTDSNGQQWVCDEIDFTRGVYVQRVDTYALEGATFEKINKPSYQPGTDGYYRYDGIAPDKNGAKNSWCLCTHAMYLGANPAKGAGAWVGPATKLQFRIMLPHETVEEAVAFIAEQHTNGTPITLLYELATPIETPLSAEELAQYAALHTNYPNTTIFNDEGADMEVKYTSGG